METDVVYRKIIKIFKYMRSLELPHIILGELSMKLECEGASI